jgi:uncharacterized protein (UPF0333 family)
MQNTSKSQIGTKKGQAAVEFLVTYGWAILGVLIVVGALAYFGIFNTQRYVSDACYFGDQMICEDYVAYQNGVVNLTLRNNFGVDIDINSTVIKSIYGNVNCVVPTATFPAGLSNIKLGYDFKIGCDITDRTIPINDKLKYKVIMTFNKNDTNNYHNQTGDVIVAVQRP